MIRKMSKKTLLWTSAVSLVLCVALVIGIIAMAIVGGGKNRITTSNLDLELWKHNGTEYVDISDGKGDIFDGGKNGVVWEPGKIELAFLQVKNTGSSDISFSVTQDVQLSDAAGVPTGLTYAVLQDMSYDDYSATNMETWKSIQKKAATQGNVVLGSTTTTSDVVLAAGESNYFVLAVHMDDKAEAAYEGITFDVTLSGKQLGGEIEEQTVFYVSPTGHDGNPGTEAEPLKTMRRVSQLAKPGQTYIFEDGTYNEGAMTVFMNSGTEEAPITIKARNAGKVKIVYPESLCGTDCMQIKNKEYITIEGFDITQVKMADDTHPNANMDILIRVASCNNITFRNNTLHGALEEPLKVAGASGLLIEGNYIYNSGCEAIDFVNVRDSIVRNNTCEDIGRVALMCKGGSRSNLFYNNYIVNKNVKGQWAMQLGGATDNVSTWGCTTEDWEAFNCYAFNNVIVAQDNGSWDIGLSFMGAKDCGFFNNVVIGAVIGMESQTANNEVVQWEWSPTVNNPQFKNNIIMNSKRAAYNMKDEPINPDFDYNLFYGNAGTDPQEAHSIYNKDPMFVADKSDWHLKAGSPAIGAGTAIGEQKGLSGQSFFVAFDKDYTLRGDTWDMGVYDMDGTEKYEPGGLVFQDPSWLAKVDHTIYEAPEVGSMPEAGTVLIEEDFESTTTLEAWLECARSKGQWILKNGLLQMNTTDLEGHAILGARDGLEWSDYEFSATVLSPSKNGPSSGIVFRADEGLENMYGFRFHPESGGEQMEFCVWNNDKFASIKYLKFDWSTNKLYDLKVIAVGDQFEFYVNDKKIGTAKDSTHPVGTAAVYSFRESRMFDNISVKSARGYQIVQMQEVDDTPEYTGKILYEESFTDPAVMSNWKEYSGEWKINGGIMTGTTGIPGENIIIYEGGYDWVNYEFTCDVRQPEKGGMWAGLIFRCNDNKTGYYGFRFVNDNTQVVKGWPGSWTQMGVKAMSSLPKGEVAELKVIVIDDTFRLYLNGMKVWEDDDKMYKKGSIGLFQQNMTEVIFDNIVVKEIASDGVEIEPEVDTTPTGKVVYTEDFSKPANAEQWMNLKGESGEFSFADGQLKFKQTGDEEGNSTYYADGYWKNFTMVLNMTLPDTYTTNGWFQIFFRTSDCRDGSYIYLMNLTNSDRMRIMDSKNGMLKEVVGGAVTAYHDGREHEVKIKVKDNTLEVLIDDWSVATYESDKLCTDPGSIGFAAYNNEGYMVNDIKIYCDDNPILKKPAPGEEVDTYVPDGTLVLDESMDAQPTDWEIMGEEYGSFFFEDGKAGYNQIDKGNGGTLLYKKGYWKNFTLMFDATFPRTDKATGWLRIGLRTTDGQDKPFVYFQNLSRDYLKVNERLEELNLTYGGNVSKFHDGNEHKVRIEVKNDTIDIYVDNVLLLSTTDERIIPEPGTISFTCFGNGYTFDNVKVYTTDDPILEKPEGPNTPGTSDPSDPDAVPGYDEKDVILREDFADKLDENWTSKGDAEISVKDGVLTMKSETSTGSFVWYNLEEASRWADYDIHFKMTANTEGGKWAGVVFRAKDDLSKYYHMRFLNKLVQLGSSTQSDLKNYSTGVTTDGNTHNICISVKGGEIKVYIDGKRLFTVEDTSLIGGTVGFGVQNATATFDDLVVVKTGDLLPEGATEPTEPPATIPAEDRAPTYSDSNVILKEEFNNDLSDSWQTKGDAAISVDNGKLTVDSTSDTGSFVWYTGTDSDRWGDYDIHAKISSPDGNGKWSGIILRAKDDLSKYYHVRFLNGNLQFGSNKSSAIKNTNSSAATDGKMHDICVSVKGDTVKIYVDGRRILTVQDPSLVGGTVGFGTQHAKLDVEQLVVVKTGDLLPEGATEPTEPPATVPAEDRVPTYSDSDVILKEEFNNDLSDSWQTKGDAAISVDNGKLTVDSTSNTGSFVWYTGTDSGRWGDYDIHAKITSPDGNGKWSGIILRAKDDLSKYYHVRFLNGNLQFGSNKNSAIKNVNSSAATDGKLHDICVSVKGDIVKIYIDGARVLTVQDASIIGGTVGFGTQSAKLEVEDLVVVKTGDLLPEGAIDPTEPPVPTEPPYDSSTDVIDGDEVMSEDFTANGLGNWDISMTGGKYDYVDGKVQYITPYHSLYYKNGNWTNFTMTFKAVMPQTTDSSSWLHVYLRTASDRKGPYIYLLNAGTDSAKIMSGGVVVEEKGTNIFDGKEHYFKIVVEDTTISLFVDGKEILTATDDKLEVKPGSICFYSYSRAYSFSDIKIYNQDPPVETTPTEPGATQAPTVPPVTEPEDVLYENDFSNALESGWKTSIDNATVENGALKIGLSDKITYAWYTSATTSLWKDYDVSAKITVPSSNGKWVDLIFRTADDLDNYYRIMFFNGKIYLRDKAGAYLANASFTADGAAHDVTVAIRTGENGESTVSVYYDNALKINNTVSGIAAGGVGFGAQNMEGIFDDLKVVNKGAAIVPPVEPPTTQPSEPVTTAPSEPVTTVPSEPATEDVLYENDFSNALESGWQSRGDATVAVNDGKLIMNSSTATGSFTWYTSELTSQWKDYDVTVNMTVPGTNGCWSGLMFRSADDANKYYYVYFVNGEMRLRTNNAAIVTGSFAKDGAVHNLKVSVRGDSIVVYYDGVEKFNVTNAAISAGGIGFCVQNMEASFDDIKVVNKGEPVVAKTNVTVSAQFNDNNNELSNRITEFAINLSGNGASYPAVLKADDSWTYTFEVPKYDGQGNEINYALDMPTVNGYRTSLEEQGTKVVLDPLTSFAGSIVWDHDDNLPADQPNSVRITLMQGAAEYASTIVNTDSFAFNELPQFVNDELAQYTVMVMITDIPAGYTVSISGGTVTLRYIPAATSVDFSIVWDDGENLDNIRPTGPVKVTVMGYKNGDLYSTDEFTVTSAENWQKTVELRESHGGVTISYVAEVEETNLPTGYTMTSNANNVITLKHAPETLVALDEDFSGADSGSNWTRQFEASLGSWSVVDGKLTLSHDGSNTGVPVFFKDNGVKIQDFTLSAKVDFGAGGRWFKIHFRSNASKPYSQNTLFFFNMGNSPKVVYGSSAGGSIYKSNGGAVFTGEQLVTLTVIGNQFTLTVGDNWKWERTMSDSSWVANGGTIGFEAIYNCKIDDIKLIDKTNYTVTWDVEGVETEETYMAGKTPAFTGSTDKAEDAENTYTFAGWDSNGDGTADEIQRVTKDVTYKALYTATAKE